VRLLREAQVLSQEPPDRFGAECCLLDIEYPSTEDILLRYSPAAGQTWERRLSTNDYTFCLGSWTWAFRRHLAQINYFFRDQVWR
jgi:hypothetical protein